MATFIIGYTKTEDGIKVVCMQDFDEGDYNQNNFVNIFRYASEEEAEEALTLV